MVTKKQLAALAYGRSIRRKNLAKLSKRKTTKTKYRRSKKITKLTAKDVGNAIVNFGDKLKVAGGVIDNFITPFSSITAALETGTKFKNAIKSFFEDEKKLDTDKLKVVIGNMKKNLKYRNPEYVNSTLYNKLIDIEKNLLYVEMLKTTGEHDKEAKEAIQVTLRMLSIALSDYATLMGQ